MQKKRRELPPLSFYRSNFLFADADQAHDNRAEHHVEQQLKEEIAADQHINDIAADISKAHFRTPAGNFLHKEQLAAKQEDARVENRAHHSRSDHSKRAVLPSKSLINAACCKTCDRPLDKHRQDCAERVDAEKRGGIAADQHRCAKNKAEPCTCACSVERRTDDDRHQHERDGEGAELDEAAKHLQDKDDGGKQAETDKLLRAPTGTIFHLRGLLSFIRSCADGGGRLQHWENIALDVTMSFVGGHFSGVMSPGHVSEHHSRLPAQMQGEFSFSLPIAKGPRPWLGIGAVRCVLVLVPVVVGVLDVRLHFEKS